MPCEKSQGVFCYGAMCADIRKVHGTLPIGARKGSQKRAGCFSGAMFVFSVWTWAVIIHEATKSPPITDWKRVSAAARSHRIRPDVSSPRGSGTKRCPAEGRYGSFYLPPWCIGNFAGAGYLAFAGILWNTYRSGENAGYVPGRSCSVSGRKDSLSS